MAYKIDILSKELSFRQIRFFADSRKNYSESRKLHSADMMAEAIDKALKTKLSIYL